MYGGERVRVNPEGCAGFGDASEIYKARILRFWSDELQPSTKILKRSIQETRYNPNSNCEKMFPQTVMRRASLFLALSLIIVCFMKTGSGQVTFSRDWNPGKRSIPGEGSCIANAKAATAAFHVLMNDLRYLAVCEARAVVQLLKAQDEGSSDRAVYYGGR